ncbi:MAG: 30S ribosomal protein S2 [Candidatus Saccharibacteria bacterium]
MATKASIKKETAPSVSALKELLAAGAHFGHKTSRWHPKMAPFIHSARGGVHIIDLIQTEQRLVVAEKFVEQLASQGKTILFVATKRQAKTIVEQAAQTANMPYVTYRWLGGMLTNWQTISGRLKYLKSLEIGKEDGSWDKLTKKERLLLDEKIIKLSRVFDGVRNLVDAPDAIFVIDVPREGIAIKEAINLKIPVIGMLDTNANPAGIDYPIPANDDAVKSVALIANRIAQAIAQGRMAYDAKTVDKSEAEAKAVVEAKPEPAKAETAAPEAESKATDKKDK